MLSSKVANHDKLLDVSSILGDCEENPVTSSSQDSTGESLCHSSLIPTSSDDSKSFLGTTSPVTSTTAPEIVDADSSTSSTSKRKTRNVKRVNYTEMLEEDFDQDGEKESFRKSKTSGRKILPVKRTLEKAIVDASMKKSPRKRKIVVDAKSSNKCSELSTASSSNTESGKTKLTKPTKTMPLTGQSEETDVPPECKQLNTNAHSPKAHMQSLPISSASMSKPHTVMFLSDGSHVTTAAHSPLNSGSMAVRHPYLLNPYQHNTFPIATIACQSGSFPFDQQVYSASSGQNIPQNSGIPSTSLQNSSFAEFNNFNLVTQSQFLKPLPVVDPHDYSRYSSNSYLSPQFATFHAHPPGSFVYNLNQPPRPPPNFLFESQISTTAPNSKAPHSLETPQHVVRHEATVKREEQQLENSSRSLVVPAIHKAEKIPQVRHETINQHPSNLTHDPTATLQEQKTLLHINKGLHQDMQSNSQQHFLSEPVKNISQNASAMQSLSTIDINISTNSTANFSPCKMQSQHTVENMLNLIHKSPAGERNIVNSNKEVRNKIQSSSETTSAQKRMCTESMHTLIPQNTCTTAELLVHKRSDLTHTQSHPGSTPAPHTVHPGLQGNHAKSIGPPPPLIAMSDVCHFPTTVASYEKSHGTTGPLPYQIIRSPSYHNKQVTSTSQALPQSTVVTVQSVLTGDREPQYSDITRHKSTAATLSSSSSLQHVSGSLHLQSVQPHPTYPKPMHLYMPSQSDQKIMQGNLSGNQIHLPSMPALLGPINSSPSVRSNNIVYQSNRMSAPELPPAYLNKHASFSIMSSTNTTPVRRATSGASIRPAHQVPTKVRTQLANNVPNTFVVYRSASPHRPNFKLVATTGQQKNFQRQTVTSNPRTPVVSQPIPTSLHNTITSNIWRPPFGKHQEPALPTSNKSSVDIHYHNQISQTSSSGRDGQSTQPKALPKTVDHTSENIRDIHSPSTNSRRINLPSRNADQRGSHMNPQKISSCNILSTMSRNRVTVNLPCNSADMATRKPDTNSVSMHTVQGNRLIVSAAGTVLAAESTPANNRLLYALDLSHKSSQFEQRQHTSTLSVNLSSATTVSSLTQDQLSTASRVPRVAYDYPLTNSQIKQEFISQSESDNSEVLHPDLQKTKSHTSLGAETTSCHMIVGECLPVTPHTVQSIFSQQKSHPASNLTETQTSKQITNSQECVIGETMGTSSSNVSVMKHINIKVEAHLSSRENPGLASSTVASSISQSPFLTSSSPLTSSPQTPHKTLVTTSLSSEPQMSIISTNTRPFVEKTPNFVTVSAPHADPSRTDQIDKFVRASAGQGNLIRTTFPAGVRIKTEMWSDIIAEKSTDTVVSSSHLNNTLASSRHLSVASTGDNNSTDVSDIIKSTATASDSTFSVSVISTEDVPHPENVQISKNFGHPVLNNIGIVSAASLTTEHTLITCKANCLSNSQPVISQAASTHMLYPMSSTNACVRTGKSTTVQDQEPTHPRNMRIKVEHETGKTFQTVTMNSSTATDSSTATPEVYKVLQPVSTIGTSVPKISPAANMPAYSESAKNNVIVIISPEQSAVSPKKQPVSFSQQHCTFTNDDPLFAWHIDSPNHGDSFLLDDVTGSDASISNIYTVTVSVPCTDSSSLLSSLTDASFVDVTAVKVEPNSQPATLNQREIIDLCVSDNDEDDPLNIDEMVYEPRTYQNPNSRNFLHATYSTAQETSAINQAALPALESINNRCSPLYVDPKTPVEQTCYLSSNSDQHELANRDAASVIYSPGHLKSAGQDIVINAEQINYIHNRLARISADMSSITTASEETSTPRRSVELHSTPAKKNTERSSVMKEPELNQNFIKKVSSCTETLVEPTYTSINKSQNQESNQMFDTLGTDSGNRPSTRNQTRELTIKKEHIEVICIDDDDDDEFEDTASSELPHFSSDFPNLPRVLERRPSGASSSSATVEASMSPIFSGTPLFASQKTQQSTSGSNSPLVSPTRSTKQVLESIASWTDDEVSEWLQNHKLDRICPNLSSLDARGLQRMAFEHQRDPDLFYTRVKKTLGLTFFQTMIICHSMKELNDRGHVDN